MNTFRERRVTEFILERQRLCAHAKETAAGTGRAIIMTMSCGEAAIACIEQ